VQHKYRSSTKKLSVRAQVSTSTVAGQFSQLKKMTSTQGISCVVVVTGDTNIGLLTLITKVIVSQSQCSLALIYTECFIMFSAIANIYNKKTKGPTLMEFFTATEKLKKFFFDN